MARHLVILTVLYLLSLSPVHGETLGSSTSAPVPLMAIKSDPELGALYREIVERLNSRHYRKATIDDQLSKRYLDAYLDMLDPQKSYFYQSDIDEFGKLALSLDDLLLSGDISPGYKMYNRLRERASARLVANKRLLESDVKFDLNSDATLIVNSDKRTWLESPAEADAYWLGRIQDSLIRLLINDKDLNEARELLVKRFTNQLKQYQQRDSQDVFQLYVNAFAELYDPHTAYYSPRTSENFQINMSLSLEGIGAELRTEDDYTKVVRIIPGGPADMQGILQAEDRIIGVGQGIEPVVDVVGWRIDDVVGLIRGPKDSTVRLQILPANADASGAASLVAIVRDKVKLEEKSAQKRVIEIEEENQTYRIGVLEVPAFYMDFEAYRARDPDFKSTSRDVFRLLQELATENIDGIVLDLRNNGGGSLREAIQLTDLFIDTGPVVQIRDARKRVSPVQSATHRRVYNGPLLVMINRLSASASEITAGALQDYGRALVVGSQSFGKGTVQDVSELSRGQLKMTISKFYRVSGDSTQHRGVVPDIELPSAFDPDEIGESQRETALPWDRIPPVSFNQSVKLQTVIAPLTSLHQKRIEQVPDFAHLVGQLNLSRQWGKDDVLSLNLQARRDRINDWDSRQLALENTRLRALELPIHTSVQDWKDAEAIKKARSHAIRSGDTLSGIAKKYAVSIEQLLKANDLTLTDSLRIGLQLKLGKSSDSSQPDPLLDEAGHILVDQIRLQGDGQNRRLVDNNRERFGL